MKKIGLFLLLGVSLSWLVSACQGRQQEVRKEVPLDSIVLSDPCILADRKTAMYYGEFYQFNLSSCIRQQNSLTAQFVSFSLSNLANIFYPPQFLQ